jgi:hypothetical protein
MIFSTVTIYLYYGFIHRLDTGYFRADRSALSDNIQREMPHSARKLLIQRGSCSAEVNA